MSEDVAHTHGNQTDSHWEMLSDAIDKTKRYLM